MTDSAENGDATDCSGKIGNDKQPQTWSLVVKAYLAEFWKNLSEIPPPGKVVVYYRPY